MTRVWKQTDADALRAQAFATVILNSRGHDASETHRTRPFVTLLKMVTGLWRGTLNRRVLDASRDRMVDAVTL